MALNKEFYASMFAASAARAIAPRDARTDRGASLAFAANAKKEAGFDFAGFMKDLAAVRFDRAWVMRSDRCRRSRRRVMGATTAIARDDGDRILFDCGWDSGRIMNREAWRSFRGH